MKATGIVRRIDDLGRIVVPKELRRTLNIVEQDAMEIFTEGDTIILRKYNPGCIFCNSNENVQMHNEKMICSKCIKEIAKKKTVKK